MSNKTDSKDARESSELPLLLACSTTGIQIDGGSVGFATSSEVQSGMGAVEGDAGTRKSE